MSAADVDFETWLDRKFGRAVTGEWYPQFVQDDEWPEPVPDHLALDYLTRLFEHPDEALRNYSDRQIACGLWELGPGDAHCVFNQSIAVEARERFIGSVETLFRDFFDQRCVPKLAHLDTEYTEPLNSICYMWWEVITLSGANGDPAAERLNAKDLDVMEVVLQLPNPACKESALHGLGHLVHRSSRAQTIIDRFLAEEAGLNPELAHYARSASTGCIQ